VALILSCTVLFALGGALFGLGGEREYRARSYVIRVPAELARAGGVELARSEPVLREAIALSGVRDVDANWLRRHSTAEVTSRLDLTFTVEADRPEDAMAVATGYAKAFRRSIPDDKGLPVLGRGAHRVQGEPGLTTWVLLGALLGVGVGAALAVVRDGIRRPRDGRPLQAA
jgi:hypothetical protein